MEKIVSSTRLFHEIIAASKPAFDKMCGTTPIPRFRAARQSFPTDRVGDVAAAARAALAAPGCLDRIKPGMRIAIGVGSRGIANLPLLTRELAAAIRAAGGEPFIVPAMGSHGGATAEGQAEMLAGLGVDEAACGAPVVSSMEVRQIGETRMEIKGTPVTIPVYLDAAALDADGIVLVQRVKPHTAFRGRYESGLCKMLVIGFGKHRGAMAYHRYGFGPFAELMPKVAAQVLRAAPVLFGLAVVENAYHDTALVEAVPSEDFLAREPELLKYAFSLMGRLYFDHLDVLIVEEIGKNFSGDGMDPNITGTFPTPFAGQGLDVESRVVLRLSEETHGNAIGLGMADFSTVRAFLQADPIPTYTNSLTSRVSCVAKVPLLMPDDETAIKAAIYKSTSPTAEVPRIVKIRNTGNMELIGISEALWAEAEAHPSVALEGEPYALRFDAERMLLPEGA